MNINTNHDLSGCKVAILALDGFEQVELTGPRQALLGAGASVEILSAKPGQIQGFHHDKPGDRFDVDGTLDRADPGAYDGVVLPGGVMNGDALRIDPHAQKFVQTIQRAGRPIAVICHGGWLLVSAGLVEGRRMTSWPTLQDDIRNAGGRWSDEPVVRDGNWVSSRKPDDIPQFNSAMLELLASRVAAY